jgi:spore coat protein CotF
MASLFSEIFGNEDTAGKDAAIANDMLASSKLGATAYLTASLECVTPEIRRLFGQYSIQLAQGHEALTEIAVNKGWYSPYDTPAEQLQKVYERSQELVKNIQM